MSNDRGSSGSGGGSDKSGSGSVSKSRSGVRVGEQGAQTIADSGSKDGSSVGGTNLQKAADGSVESSGVKNFDVMAPLTFPTAVSLETGGNGNTGGPALAPTLEPTPIDTTVTPAATDVVTAIASQVGQAAPRPAAVNNNFTSLASRAGTKRSLIGGA